MPGAAPSGRRRHAPFPPPRSPMPESPSPSVPGNSAALLAARDGAILCDLAPAAVLAIEGADAASFLHGQLSSDVAGLDHDACQYTSYNSPSGRMLANFVLWRAGPDPADGFRALLPGDIAAAVRKRLAMFVLRSKVIVTARSRATPAPKGRPDLYVVEESLTDRQYRSLFTGKRW